MFAGKNDNNSYSIDIMKYIAAIMVIIIHVGPIFEHWPLVNHVFVNGICRVATPLFFVSSAFFVRHKMKSNPQYLKQYVKSIFKIYCFWSLVYLPLGLQYIAANFDIPLYLYPVALVIAFFYIGTYYHLWYIPALLFGLWFVDYLMKHMSKRIVYVLVILLYAFACLETHRELIANTYLLTLIDTYLGIFVTPRNGLFFAPIFITIGYVISDQDNKSTKRTLWLGMLLSLAGLIAEGTWIYYNRGHDSNALVFLAPLSYFIFKWVCTLNVTVPFNTKVLRRWSTNYYFGHLLILTFCEWFFGVIGLGSVWMQFGLMRFVLVLALTHIAVEVGEYLRIRFTSYKKAIQS